MTIIYFILILGTTVFVHEFGHFMFAKKFGVHVYEFSLGMGPRLFKFNRKNDETDYCIRLFPIGGFVQMAGEELEVDDKIPENERLQSKKPYQRFLIMVAGVMMNFLLAIVLLFLLGLFNKVSTDSLYIKNSFVEDLPNGSKITAVDGHFVNNYDKLALELTIVGDKDFTLTIKDKNNIKKNIKISPIQVGKDNLVLGYDYGFSIDDLEVTKSKLNNLNIGDKIIKIDKVEISSYLELLKEINNKDNFILTVKAKNGIEKNIKIVPKRKNDEEVAGNSFGFYIDGKEERGLFSAIKYAIYKFISTIEQMIFTVLYLITGKISLSMLSGPVGIFNVVSVYSKTGFSNIVSLLALICINVGFINILPLPAFDGGHVLFILIEKIKGSKVSPKVENMIHNIGFILLMILMVLITYNDILKLLK